MLANDHNANNNTNNNNNLTNDHHDHHKHYTSTSTYRSSNGRLCNEDFVVGMVRNSH